MGDAARKLPPGAEQGSNVVAGPWAQRASEPSLRERTADVFSRVLPGQWPGYAPRDGRLIRSVNDWGAVVVCDPRLTSARYGAGVVKALGMPAQVRSVGAAAAWFAARAAAAVGCGA